MENYTLYTYSGEVEGSVGHGATYEEAEQQAQMTDAQREQNGLFALGLFAILFLVVIFACIHKRK